ncbi:acyl--CoA ligase [Actinomadura madurae]|uniref:class I adenylate-forming enzyme family protein n=1 Tax=Actinomadura madurae TaxID=1993 RepID=UPI00202640A6|nr:class I adenylate-forming enzyme family protein [Actinomadura madurae]URN00954.1 acyl--CoA ligase [Actinomadura madurae]
MDVHIVELIDTHLAAHGDRVRATDHTGSWTGHRLAERARLLAGGLQARGVRRGDRVGVMMANGVDVLVAYEAIWRAGAAITPLMPALVPDEVAHILESAEPAAVLVSADTADTVRAARAATGGTFPLAGDGGDVPWAGSAADAVPGGHDEGDLAAVLFTGGTTGRSKGVMLTHRNLTAAAAMAATADDARPEDVSLVTLPLSHGFGLIAFLVTYLRPLRLLVRRRFDPDDFAATVRAEGVTVADVVPAMLQALLDQGHVHSGALRTLRTLYVGGAPCPPDLIEAFEDTLPVRVIEGYGLTESGALIAGDSPSRPHRRGSVGIPFEGVDVRIVDPAGRDVPPGRTGEIIVRGPAVMGGYWRDEAATAEAIRDGWLHTGDLGSQDEDGYLRIAGRRKELIIRAGFNIHPADLENAIRTCPGVAGVGVVGIPDRTHGERVVAAVVGTCTPEDVHRHCRTRVAGPKRPDEVVIVERLPLTAVGKPDRNALVAALAEQGIAS